MEIKPETAVDQALQMARDDQKNGNLFYDAFLNADLFIPVKRAKNETGTWSEVAANEPFFPLFLNLEGTKVIPAFDRLDRLQFWAEGRPLDYLKVRSHLFLKTVAHDVAMALNLGNAFHYLFTPEVLTQLRQAVRTVVPS